MIDRADELIAGIPVLDDMASEDRLQAVDHVARMLTHNDVSLFLAGIGQQSIITTNFKACGIGEKMIIVHGEKEDGGVNSSVYFINPDSLDEFLENY